MESFVDVWTITLPIAKAFSQSFRVIETSLIDDAFVKNTDDKE